MDRCSRKVWLIKSQYKNEYYTDKIIYEYLIRNEIKVRSITVDNGLEFQALGLTANTARFKGEQTKEPMHLLEDLFQKETL